MSAGISLKTTSPLTEAEIQLALFHADPTTIGQMKRMFWCFKDLSNARKCLAIYVTSLPIILSFGVGAVSMGAIKGSSGNSSDMKEWTIIGGIIGGLTSTPVAVQQAYKTFAKSKDFKDWQTKALINIYARFETLLKLQDLSDLICPISGIIPRTPVKAPCGHTFEFSAIVKHLKNRLITDKCCPVNHDTAFTLEDLVYDQEHVYAVVTTALARIQALGKHQESNSHKIDLGFTAAAIQK